MVKVQTNTVGEIIQGAIALLIVVGAFLLAAYLVYRGEPFAAAIAVISTAVGPIAGFYFGQRSTLAGMVSASNGMSETAIKMAQQVQEGTRAAVQQSAAERTATAVDH